MTASVLAAASCTAPRSGPTARGALVAGAAPWLQALQAGQSVLEQLLLETRTASVLLEPVLETVVPRCCGAPAAYVLRFGKMQQCPCERSILRIACVCIWMPRPLSYNQRKDSLVVSSPGSVASAADVVLAAG